MSQRAAYIGLVKKNGDSSLDGSTKFYKLNEFDKLIPRGTKSPFLVYGRREVFGYDENVSFSVNLVGSFDETTRLFDIDITTRMLLHRDVLKTLQERYEESFSRAEEYREFIKKRIIEDSQKIQEEISMQLSA